MALKGHVSMALKGHVSILYYLLLLLLMMLFMLFKINWLPILHMENEFQWQQMCIPKHLSLLHSWVADS
jgi:hypothetical protein